MRTLDITSFIIKIALITAVIIGCERGYDQSAVRRIAILEDARTVNSGELTAYFTHPDDIVRLQTAAAAGRIADKSMTPHLLKLLYDKNHEVQYEACFALGQMSDSSAAGDIIKWYETADSTGKKLALEALGKIGGVSAVSFLLTEFHKGNPALIPPIVHAFIKAGADSMAVLIPDLLKSDNPAIRTAGAYFAYRIKSPQIKDALLSALDDTEPKVRKYAAGGLGRIQDPSCAVKLSALFKDSSEAAAIQAVRAAGKCGDNSVVPQLMNLLDTDNHHIYVETLQALGNLKAESAIERLESITQKTYSWELPYLVKALAQIEGERFIPFLDTYSDHPDVKVRRATGESLRFVSRKKAVLLAEDMMMDEDAIVRTAVTANISHMSEKVEHIFIDALSDIDWAVRSNAAAGLGAIGKPEYFAKIQMTLDNPPGSSCPEEIMTHLEILFKLDGQKSLTVLKKYINFEDQSIDRLARNLLSQTNEIIPSRLSPNEADYPEDFGRLLGRRRVSLLTETGRIEIELFGDEAPVITAQFLKSAGNRFYRGLSFHRVIGDFVVQTGDPRGDGCGGSGDIFRDQINRHRFVRGTVGMATSGPDLGGSQFFVCLSDQPHLDGLYTAFGRVIRGWEALDRIKQGEKINEIIISTEEAVSVKYKEI